LALIANPASGRGRGARLAPEADRLLQGRGIDTVLLWSSSGPDVERLAREAVAGTHGSVDAVIACGGDGTVHAVVQAVAGTGVTMGILPVGTGDDNARNLGLPIDDVAAAVEVLSAGSTRVIDAAHVVCEGGVERWFLAVLSTGFDSNVNERANHMAWPKGQQRYTMAMLRELGSFRAVPYRLEVDGVEHTGRGMLLSIGNGPGYGGGMLICPSAQIDDGVLDLTWLAEVSKPTFLRAFPRVFRGTHVNLPYVTELRGQRIRVEATGQVAYADGERVGPLPIDITAVPGALRVLTPAGTLAAT
jgi:diacylglycerol kinase (ATP)